MTNEVWVANAILVLHTIIVGITVAGGIALFTGRFARFHKKDFFAWAFILCSFGQIFSLIFTGGCILTEFEKQIRAHAEPTNAFSKTFLEEYMPFLPEGFIQAVPFLTLGALIGAIIQIYFAIGRKKKKL